MQLLEDLPCKYCKKLFTPKVEWQKFCPKKKGKKTCHDKYWTEVYRGRSAMNRRMDAVEKKVGIK